MNYITLDTETTGFYKNDKILEIGCVDITNKQTYHQYINPERSIPEESTKIHGITSEFIKNYRPFIEYADDFLYFIKDATLIIHNASFDIRFLNTELEKINKPKINNPIIDTLKLAKTKFPGQKASLEALQKKYEIKIERKFHGALLDATILTYIYKELIKDQEKLELKEDIEQKMLHTPSKKQLKINQFEKDQNLSFFNK